MLQGFFCAIGRKSRTHVVAESARLANIAGLRELYEKFRKKSLDQEKPKARSETTHLAKLALHFDYVPTALDPD